ncbi:hypothetical protein [Nocardioides sp. YIM 152315]|uniref:hypothetical protein n=1 Tax=Nocardioides sp. YIM 152315 TaxID=3031760 RepID=UPI0023D99E37|nr:hypothetical protein [Nocardioides sp. YIM 152315]MDF1604128.1 hypothetical protein [Nocardioides sp. YIM 152315]
MPLSPADHELVADMKQRALHLKSRQRAADRILYELRRFRVILLALAAVVVAAAVTGFATLVQSTLPDRPGSWRQALVVAVIGAWLGVHLGQSLLRTDRGRRLLDGKEGRLRQKYSGDLHSGRRWLQFYYQGEDISAYVPQVLYFIEGERRFDSVDAALAFAKDSRRESHAFAARALETFNEVAARTNTLVVASTDETGRPSSRIMRFVRSERPGVWFVTAAPDGPKVHEFDLGRIALVTQPTESGATISSNRVRIERAGVPFGAVAGLYRAQVPGYADGMTETEQQRELVYELTLQSARVETWLDHEVVEFCAPEVRGTDR